MISAHVAEHRQMLDLASAILAATSTRQPARCDELARLRLGFARLVNTHCVDEARTIRAGVEAGSVCPAVAATLHRELQQWRAALVALNGEWPSSRVGLDPGGFASAFRVMVDLLRRYIAREENEILDRIAAAG